MTTQEQATMENYVVLACEVALRAYNDLVKASIDLYSLEHPDENDITMNRYLRIGNRLKNRIVRNYHPEHREGMKLYKILKDEIPMEAERLRANVRICRLFFEEPHPLCGYLGLDGKTVLKNAEDKLNRWLAGEKIKIQNSARGIYFDYEEEDEEDRFD